VWYQPAVITNSRIWSSPRNSISGQAGFALTPEGQELLAAYSPIGAWAERWAARENYPG